MEWTTPPVVPAPAPVAFPTPAIEPMAATTQPTGFGMRRTVLTAALSALLLIGGAAAVVSAASPEPSAAPSTIAPSGGSGGSSGTGTQPAPRQHGTGSAADCPNMGDDNGSGSESGTTPSEPTTPTTPTLPAATPLT